jgi:hypothetical protein
MDKTRYRLAAFALGKPAIAYEVRLMGRHRPW